MVFCPLSTTTFMIDQNEYTFQVKVFLIFISGVIANILNSLFN